MAWTTRFTDALTGANGTTLQAHDAAWVKRETIDATIQSNAGSAPATPGAGNQVRYSINVALANDQAIQAVYLSPYNLDIGIRHTHTGTGDGYSGVQVRYAGATGAAELYARYSGAFHLLASTTPATYTGTWRLEGVSTGFTTYRNASTTGMPSASDANVTSGDAFLRAATATSTFDDVQVDDDAGASAGGPLTKGGALTHGSLIRGGRLVA